MAGCGYLHCEKEGARLPKNILSGDTTRNSRSFEGKFKRNNQLYQRVFEWQNIFDKQYTFYWETLHITHNIFPFQTVRQCRGLPVSLVWNLLTLCKPTSGKRHKQGATYPACIVLRSGRVTLTASLPGEALPLRSTHNLQPVMSTTHLTGHERRIFTCILQTILHGNL